METRVLKVCNGQILGSFRTEQNGCKEIDHWELPTDAKNGDLANLQQAAEHLRTTDIPVGFPTETVYGLGADATRSAAVKGIYRAKGRPSDNPLIVHVCDLAMLSDLLSPRSKESTSASINESTSSTAELPAIYKPLVEKFWPGPLTIILPNPQPSKLAPEVTAGLQTFGARMPALPLARSLIKLAGAPLAGPSANASTKPSPTTAQHVLDDLDGRIELIVDGGPCTVGVESTVVDGLCDPPVILRPGGVSAEELKSCAGWEKVEKAYKDQTETGTAAPRAPGMKYKHYSPKAKVVLYEVGDLQRVALGVRKATGCGQDKRLAVPQRFGIVRTGNWPEAAGLEGVQLDKAQQVSEGASVELTGPAPLAYIMREGAAHDVEGGGVVAKLLDVDLGNDTRKIAQGLFSVLRELDRREVDVIFVEGIEDRDDIAAAVMNRLRKAASEIIS